MGDWLIVIEEERNVLQEGMYLAASPTHTVETSGRICLIVSKMAIPKQIKSS